MCKGKSPQASGPASAKPLLLNPSRTMPRTPSWPSRASARSHDASSHATFPHFRKSWSLATQLKWLKKDAPLAYQHALATTYREAVARDLEVPLPPPPPRTCRFGHGFQRPAPTSGEFFGSFVLQQYKRTPLFEADDGLTLGQLLLACRTVSPPAHLAPRSARRALTRPCLCRTKSSSLIQSFSLTSSPSPSTTPFSRTPTAPSSGSVPRA